MNRKKMDKTISCKELVKLCFVNRLGTRPKSAKFFVGSKIEVLNPHDPLLVRIKGQERTFVVTDWHNWLIEYNGNE